MNTYTRIALAAAICAASLSLTACSAGITTASPAATSTPAASRAGSSPAAPPSHSPSPSPTATVAGGTGGTGGTVRVNSPIGSFPIPKGATVQLNDSCRKQVALMLGPVAPSRAMAFYATALPRAGYKITGNLSSGSGSTGMMEVDITGHGYTGDVAAFADLAKSIGSAAGNPSLGAGMPSEMTMNIVQVSLSLPGTPDTYNCPD